MGKKVEDNMPARFQFLGSLADSPIFNRNSRDSVDFLDAATKAVNEQLDGVVIGGKSANEVYWKQIREIPKKGRS